MYKKDLTGQRFGRLIAVERQRVEQTTYYICRCDCGVIKKVTSSNLQHNTKSCGCIGNDYRKSSRFTELNKKHPTHGKILTYYKRNAFLRGFPWELSGDEFTSLVTSNCHYCGALPAPSGKTLGSVDLNGIDRLDSGKGYYLENVVTSCRNCNWAKRSRSYSDFLEWVHIVAKRFPQ